MHARANEQINGVTRMRVIARMFFYHSSLLFRQIPFWAGLVVQKHLAQKILVLKANLVCSLYQLQTCSQRTSQFALSGLPWGGPVVQRYHKRKLWWHEKNVFRPFTIFLHTDKHINAASARNNVSKLLWQAWQRNGRIWTDGRKPGINFWFSDMQFSVGHVRSTQAMLSTKVPHAIISYISESIIRGLRIVFTQDKLSRRGVPHERHLHAARWPVIFELFSLSSRSNTVANQNSKLFYP